METKYNEALEKAKVWYKELKDSGYIHDSKQLEKIFPELAASEDEDIRKELIEFIKEGKGYCCPSSEKRQKWANWLEKQKPADKIKPKFKVGDWVIVQEKTLFQIKQVTELPHNHYQYWTTDEHWFGDGTEARSWTIQDAKDGDILMANAPFIFNGNLEGGIGCPGAHCAINTLGKFQIPKHPEHWTGHTTTPATKEQCDLLFQKMKEAGYEWDAEKKKLTKIEQKPANKVKPKFKVGDWIVTPDNETKQIEEVGFGNYYFTDKTLYNIIDTDNKGYLWTIQDAKDGDVLAAHECYVIFKEIDGLNIRCHCTYHYMGFNPSFYVDTLQNKTAFNPATKEQRDLLFAKMKETGYEWDAEKKDLKKIEQVSDWNEEDEKIRNNIIELIKQSSSILDKQNQERMISWLEKQKKRSGLTKDEEFTLNRIIEHFEEEGGYDKWIEVLQDIRNIPYQKEQPAEWSEEDKEYQQNIIEWLECLIDDEDPGNMTYKEHKNFYMQRINWLKSLEFKSSNWKPSKEQMKELEYVTRGNSYPHLTSLYQDLKNL